MKYQEPRTFEWMRINKKFSTPTKYFRKGELHPSNDFLKRAVVGYFNDTFSKIKDAGVFKLVDFIPSDNLFKRAHKDGNFSDLLIVRYGGIGDLIALTSICDYFEDKNIHFITQERYFSVFEWFVEKPRLYDHTKGLKFGNRKKYAVYHSDNLVEHGHSQNWFELFFKFIGEDNPGKEFYRPALKADRINDNKSNIKGSKPSLLIVNRATAMMRTIKVSDILKALPNKDKYDIFVYSTGLDKDEKVDVNVIEKTDMATFFLDCYDADMVISVDTGALHFREGTEKPAIGLYNSFTTDARTKYYQYTKSYDIKSDCEMQPCFFHEKINIKHCPMGTKEMFAAPCFDSNTNDKLIEQLKEIFNELN